MKNISRDIIDLIPQTSKVMGAAEYVSFAAKQRDQIKRARFILPKIGSDDFGMFKVEFNNPIYEHVLEASKIEQPL